MTGDNYVDEMADMVHKLRMTEEASNALDSTAHALVRNLAENNQIEFLLQILRDPLNYGVFLDTYSACLLLDKLLEEQRFTAAAEVASLMMLQEDFGNDLSRALCLLAAYKYLDQPEPFVKDDKVEPEPAKNAPPPPPQAKGKKGKKEELRVRVKFLRNAYFDDHFDLKEAQHLVGKTLVRLSAELPKEVARSSQLLGLCLYEKYEDCLALLSQLSKGDVLHRDVIQRAVKGLEATPRDSEEYRSVLDQLQGLPERVSLAPESPSFEGQVVSLVQEAVARLEKETVATQEQVYQNWIAMRDQRLQDEVLRLRRASSVREFEQLAKDMEMEEKRLWFFENEEQIELEIESKEVHYPKRWHGKKKNPRVVDEGYVPPEIKTVRNW